LQFLLQAASPETFGYNLVCNDGSSTFYDIKNQNGNLFLALKVANALRNGKSIQIKARTTRKYTV